MRAVGVMIALFGLAFLGSPDGREFLSGLTSSSEAEEFSSEEGASEIDVNQEMSAREPAWTKRCQRELTVYCPWAHSLGDRKTCLKLNFADLPPDCQSSIMTE